MKSLYDGVMNPRIAEQFEQFLATVEEMIDTVSALPEANVALKNDLAESKKQFRHYAERAASIVAAHDRVLWRLGAPGEFKQSNPDFWHDIPATDYDGLFAVWQAMAYAFHIGGKVIHNELSKQISEKAHRSERAASLFNARRQQSADRQTVINQIVGPKLGTAAPSELAREAHAEIVQVMRERELLKPSQPFRLQSITRRIKNLMAERRSIRQT